MILIARFDVVGAAPVPWSVPTIGNVTGKYGKRHRFTTRNKALQFWQAYVRSFAETHMVGKEVCLNPVLAVADFRFRNDDPTTHGAIWAPVVSWNEARKTYAKKGNSIPDCDNLFKAVLDAIQGVVIGNDAQVCAQSSSRRHGASDGVHISIWEFTPGDQMIKV